MRYKFLTLFLAAMALVSFSACSDNDKEDVQDNIDKAVAMMAGSYTGVASASTMFSENSDTAHVNWTIGTQGIHVDSLPLRLLSVGVYNDSILAQSFSDAGKTPVQGAYQFTNIGMSSFAFNVVTELSFKMKLNGEQHDMYVVPGKNALVCTGYYDMVRQELHFDVNYKSVTDSTAHTVIPLGNDKGVTISFASTKRNS